jgi:probable HAF family extracellular repeat protein
MAIGIAISVKTGLDLQEKSMQSCRGPEGDASAAERPAADGGPKCRVLANPVSDTRRAILIQKWMRCVALACVLAVPTSAVAAKYTVTNLGALTGAAFSVATAINDQGQVTGYWQMDGGFSHAFVYDGSMHDLGPGQGADINNLGQVTGFYSPAWNVTHAFLYDGQMHDLGTLDDGDTYDSYGYGINDQGQVTGFFEFLFGERGFIHDGARQELGTLEGNYSGGRAINNQGHVTGSATTWHDNASRAFYYDGTMHDLGTLGGTDSVGNSINDNGLITGQSYLVDDVLYHAFLYDGTMHDLGTLGGTRSEGYGINNSGQVVGTSLVAGSGTTRAFLHESGTGMVDLNTLIDPALGWDLRVAYSINNPGQIVGIGVIRDRPHAFLLTPVPEPSSGLLAVAAALLLGVACRGKTISKR